MKNDIVSIIVPSYNDSKYLPFCLDSLINQSHENIEIIVVNDGSTDDTQKIIDSYKAKDNRIKSVYQENAGLPAARNTGLDNAGGDFVAFVDSDDSLKPNAIELLLSETDDDTDLVIGSYTEHWIYNKNIVYERKNFENEALNDEFLSFIDKTVIVCKNLYRKSVIDNHSLRFDRTMRFAEDYYFNINYLKAMNGKLVISDKLIYNYYTYRSSQHRRFFPDIYQYYCRILDAAQSYFENEDFKDEYQKYFAGFYIDTLMYYYAFNVEDSKEAEKYILTAFNELDRYFDEEIIKACLNEEQYVSLNENDAEGIIDLYYPEFKKMKSRAKRRDSLLDF